ncbi:MAG: hypothetical protein WBQ46_01610 [Terriglobales bacterium]
MRRAKPGVRKEIPMKYVVIAALVVAVVTVVGEVVVAEYTSMLFQDDMRDITAQLGNRVGLSAPTSEEELRENVIRKANGHEIPLDPKQVTAQISGPPGHRVIYIAAAYTVPVNLLVHLFSLHFTPTSTGITF